MRSFRPSFSRRAILLGALCLSGFASSAAVGETNIAVVVRPDVPVDDLTFAELRTVLLGNRQFWSSNLRVTLLARAPGAREREVGLKWARDGSAEALAQYTPPGRNVTGLTMDWTAMRIVHYPDSMDEPARKEARRFLLRNPPPPHLHQRYLQKWYGKIVDHYRGSQTRLIFTRLPRGPLPRQYPTEQPGLLREYAAHGRVTLLDEHLFDSLERPELFQDAMHLNAQGSEQFTRTLVQELDALARPNR